MNQVTLIGRLGADPQVTILGDGGKVANMRIATDESYKNDKGDKVERTEWHRVVGFSKIAQIAEDYAKKGRLVAVTGKLRTRKWTDEKNIDRYSTEIVCNSIRMLDSQKKEEPADASAPAEPLTDGVPF